MASEHHTEAPSKRLRIEREKAPEDAIREAYEQDPTERCGQEACSLSREGYSFSLAWLRPKELSLERQRLVERLLEDNMRPHYGRGWPKAKRLKRKEMMELDARYAIVLERQGAEEGEGTGEERFRGFVQYR